MLIKSKILVTRNKLLQMTKHPKPLIRLMHWPKTYSYRYSSIYAHLLVSNSLGYVSVKNWQNWMVSDILSYHKYKRVTSFLRHSVVVDPISQNFTRQCNKKLSYHRETERQLPTSRGGGPPVNSPSSGYTYAYGRMRSHNVRTSSVLYCCP